MTEKQLHGVSSTLHGEAKNTKKGGKKSSTSRSEWESYNEKYHSKG